MLLFINKLRLICEGDFRECGRFSGNGTWTDQGFGPADGLSALLVRKGRGFNSRWGAVDVCFDFFGLG